MTASVSFEFFPPNTPEGMTRLRATRAALQAVGPEYFSVTYGAGGATRDKTLATVTEIADAGLPVAPHMSCIGATRASIDELLALYRSHGIRRLVALRGDLPSGMVDHGEFRYASDLVAFIRERTGTWFHIEMAAYPEMHPQARSPGRLRRRTRIDPRPRPRRGGRPVRAAACRWRAGAALLHDEPVGPQPGAVGRVPPLAPAAAPSGGWGWARPGPLR
jgi:5,10-methylenetetrahydrofolate reductase